jgi:hypothetical protein
MEGFEEWLPVGVAFSVLLVLDPDELWLSIQRIRICRLGIRGKKLCPTLAVDCSLKKQSWFPSFEFHGEPSPAATV